LLVAIGCQQESPPPPEPEPLQEITDWTMEGTYHLDASALSKLYRYDTRYADNPRTIGSEAVTAASRSSFTVTLHPDGTVTHQFVLPDGKTREAEGTWSAENETVTFIADLPGSSPAQLTGSLVGRTLQFRHYPDEGGEFLLVLRKPERP